MTLPTMCLGLVIGYKKIITRLWDLELHCETEQTNIANGLAQLHLRGSGLSLRR